MVVTEGRQKGRWYNEVSQLEPHASIETSLLTQPHHGHPCGFTGELLWCTQMFDASGYNKNTRGRSISLLPFLQAFIPSSLPSP